MCASHYLKPLSPSDYEVVREVYKDAIESQGPLFYSHAQIAAWSAIACLPGILDRVFAEGRGWVSCDNAVIEAFALRHPLSRLALLYCRGRSAGLGHATALLDHIEMEAFNEGEAFLSTEASLCSYPLLLKRGWTFIKSETINFADVSFERYLMQKSFK